MNPPAGHAGNSTTGTTLIDRPYRRATEVRRLGGRPAASSTGGTMQAHYRPQASGTENWASTPYPTLPGSSNSGRDEGGPGRAAC